MKQVHKYLIAALAVVAFMFTANVGVRAECGSAMSKGVHPSSFSLLSPLAQAASDGSDAAQDSGRYPSIVGMWHVKFVAKGNHGGPPDNTVLENALVVWHSDRTEIMNSNRPAQDGNFCMGVWEQTGAFYYYLNHFAWLGFNDTTNSPGGVGKPIGPVHIREYVRLSPDGQHYYGNFIQEAYDTSGNRTARIVGLISATRVTTHTTIGDLM